MNIFKTSIITATTGSPYLAQTIESVQQQTYSNIEHIVVVDGPEHVQKVQEIITGPWITDKLKVIVLPHSTGKGGYNGHRIYGGASYFASGDYISFLDDDNWMEPNHIQNMIDVVLKGNAWAYALRNIVNSDGELLCKDDCESLGKWTSIINDNFVDVNCYFVSRSQAISMSPAWYRRFRHPDEQPEVDRLIYKILSNNYPTFDCSKEDSINYRVGNTERSVQKDFFIKGNQAMLDKHNGKLPWK